MILVNNASVDNKMAMEMKLKFVHHVELLICKVSQLSLNLTKLEYKFSQIFTWKNGTLWKHSRYELLNAYRKIDIFF